MKFILFDLDGTLLPMDQEVFIKTYFSLLCKKLAPFGYEPDALIKALWLGTSKMVQNDGRMSNKDVFWSSFSSVFGERVFSDMPIIDSFYENEFNQASSVCHKNPQVPKLIKRLKEAGYGLFLATNPVFPKVATLSRMNWAGLEESDFIGISAYENSFFCKPCLKYYEKILEKLGARASDCLMVGNDTAEDMVAKKLGMDVFLLTDFLINQAGEDISKYPNGGFALLEEHIFR